VSDQLAVAPTQEEGLQQQAGLTQDAEDVGRQQQHWDGEGEDELEHNIHLWGGEASAVGGQKKGQPAGPMAAAWQQRGEGKPFVRNFQRRIKDQLCLLKNGP
jgi:hypothetical protein